MAATVLKWANGLITFDAVQLEAPAHEMSVTEYPIESGSALVDHVRAKPVTLRMTVMVSNSPSREVTRIAGVEGAQPLTHMDGLTAAHDYAIRVKKPFANAPVSAQVPTSFAGVQLSREVTAIAAIRTWTPVGQHVRRVQNVYAVLLQGMAEAREHTVATDLLGDFDRMLLKSLRTERDSRSGNALAYQLEFQQVSYADLMRRDVSGFLPKPAEPRSQPKKDDGKKKTEEPDASTKRRVTTLKRATNSIGLSRGPGL